MKSAFLKGLKAVMITALVGLSMPGLAAGQYPDRPIKLVVGFPPGGGGDLYGRLLADALSKSMGANIVVDNRPGAGGNIAAELVAKSPADGYTLLLAMSGNIAVAPVVRGDALTYKSPDDFVMVGAAVEAPHGLFVPAASPFKTAQAFFDHARGKEITVGSTSPGGAAHMSLEMVKLKSQAKILYVPYRGSGPAITEMIGGQIESFFATAPPIMNQVKGGALRLLAVTGDERNPGMPDTPTFKELGIPVITTQWYGLAAPKGTPTEVVELLSQHLSKVLATPSVQSVIRQDGAIEKDLPTERFTQYVKHDIASYRENIDPKAIKQIVP